MTRRQYARTPPLPPMTRKPAFPPTVRRCGSGEYEVWHDGRMISGGHETFEDGQEWLKENPQ